MFQTEQSPFLFMKIVNYIATRNNSISNVVNDIIGNDLTSVAEVRQNTEKKR